jgi:mono/diheme cytochrome c family protein
VPGYYGVNNVKYVDTLTCSDVESTAKIQQSSYRMRGIGEDASATQPTMWRMNVKSWVSGPGGDVLVGPSRLYGVAFSGERGVRSVDVSLDGGERWAPARLVGEDLGPNAWRRFEHEVSLRPGKYRLCARATDTAGDVQPATRVDNARGYGNNAWRDHGLDVEAWETLPERPSVEKAEVDDAPRVLSAQAERGRVLFRRADPQCGNCHTKRDAGAGMSIGPDLDDLSAPLLRIQNAVENGVGIMRGYRGTLEPAEIADIAQYVFETRKNVRGG